MNRLILVSIFYVSLLLGPTGCNKLHEQQRTMPSTSNMLAATGKEWVKTELYFGMSKPSGSVTDAEWSRFVEMEITPRFPDGLTILGAYGQWRDPQGNVCREKSCLVIILHPGDSETNRKIEKLRTLFCQQFEQISVLRVTSRAAISFESQTIINNEKIFPKP